LGDHPTAPRGRGQAHASTDSQTEKYLRASYTQKIIIGITFFLTVIVVLAIPFFWLQQFISTSTPGPMGKTILPLTGQIMTGVSIPGDLDAVEKFERDAGKNVSVIVSYQAWGETKGRQDFPADWANSVRKHGAIPLITWEPWVRKDYPAGNNEPTYALKNIIAGFFDNYIAEWSIDARNWRNPFFLRFAPEMNGNWNPWSEGLNGNQAGEFVQAWRHVHDIFTANGATNVTWVWCPNITHDGSIPVSEFYPGDEYVDWTGMDGFNWGTTKRHSTWLTLFQVFSPTYNEIIQITTRPMMIAETGCVEQGGNKAVWIANAYSVELPKYFPVVKIIVWFNQSTQQDWQIESSPAALAAFSAAMRAPIYASNRFGNYTGG
jgi:beta-mannanase